MSLHSYKKASDREVLDWLNNSIDLSDYQKEHIRVQEIVRFAPFEFMKPRKVVKSFWLRLTIVIFPFVWLILFIGLPFKFLFTGTWGYRYESIKWFDHWKHNIGL